MKLPKLIALDMDGTMLNEKSELSPRTIKALREAQKAGIRLAAATGRMYPSAMLHIKAIGIKSASIFYNGALIRDPLTGETIYERRLGRELTAAVMDYFHRGGHYVQGYCDDRLVVETRDDERCRYYEKICGIDAVALGESFWSSGLDSSKLLGISFDKEDFARIYEDIDRLFSDRIYQASSWGAFVEIVHRTVNKADALSRVAAHYGINRSEVMAFGDGANDREMLEWAGLGVAMGNAKENVKQSADLIAPSHSEDGAAVVIEKLLGIKYTGE